MVPGRARSPSRRPAGKLSRRRIRRFAAWTLGSAGLLCLSGCYAAAAGIVAGVLGSKSGGGSGSTPTFEVSNPVPGLTPAVVPPGECNFQVPGIESVPELEPFAAGDLLITFDLARTDKPEAAAKAKLMATIFADRPSGKEELGSYEITGEAPGKNEFLLHTRELELTPREKIHVAIRPADGRGKGALTAPFPVDNRPAAPGGTLCFCSESCSTQLTGQVRCRWSLSGSEPIADPERVMVFIAAEGRTPEFVPTTTERSDSQRDCCANGVSDFTTMWNSGDSFARRSGNIFPILVVEDAAGRSRPAVLTADCRRLDNTRPELFAVEIGSDPEAVAGQQRLVGRVDIKFNVFDQGAEDVDLDVTIKLPKGIVLKLPGLETRPGWTITEALGEPSEGARYLETSAEAAGVPHRFVWNSDADIERLVRRGDLEPDFLEGLVVTFELTVRNVGSCLQSIPVSREPLVLENSLTHSVAGLIAGQTEPQSPSIAAGKVSFSDLSSMATDESKRFLYLTDKDTHSIWRLDFLEIDLRQGTAQITRIAGGRNQVRDDAEDPEDGVLLADALLNGPMDIAVSRDGNELFFVEKSGALSRIDLVANRLDSILTKAVLNSPEAVCLEELDGRRFLYVADTRNCRVLRVDLSATGVDDVSKVTVIVGEETRIDLAAALGAAYPLTNGCNGAPVGEEPPKPIVCRSEFGKSPAGLAIWRSREPGGTPGAQRRFLFVSEPVQDRILRIDLGRADAPDEPSFPVTEAQVALVKTGSACPDIDSGSLLAGPRALRILGDHLFIASDGVKIRTDSRGIVIRSRIVEEGGAPVLKTPEFLAGIVRKPTPSADLRCGCSDSSESNFKAEHECGLADEIPLANPTAVVEDFDGNLYICDRFNQRVRKLVACDRSGATTSGTTQVSTFVGGTVEGKEEDRETFLGLEESGAVAEGQECLLSPFPEALTREGAPAREPSSGTGGSKLSNPFGLCFVDDTTLLIADGDNHRVRRLDLRTGLITTFAGTEQDFSQKERCVDFFGNGDGVLATDALFHRPRAIAVFPDFRPRAGDRSRFACEPERAVFILDQVNHLVRRVDAAGRISTFAGSGIEGLEAGNCAREIRPPRADFPNAFLAYVPAPPTAVFLKVPRGLMIDSSGRVFIGDCRHRILVVNPEGTELRRVVGRGRDHVSLENRDASGELDPNFINRCDFDEPQPSAIGDGGDPLEALLVSPAEMVFDREERFLYFADQGNNRIRRVGPYRKDLGTFEGGTIETVAGTGGEAERAFVGARDPMETDFHQPYGVDIDYQADPPLLYFTTELGQKLYRMTIFEDVTSNRVELVAGGDLRGSAGDGNIPSKARFRNPCSLRLDRFGAVYVVDSRNHRVRRFLPPPPGPDLLGR